MVEGRDARSNDVVIEQDSKVLWSIRLPTGAERNGSALDWAKKTKEGFELSVEYGSRYYYHKRFVFLCKRDKFYLSEVIVDSFDKVNPEHRRKKTVKVKPSFPIEKFYIDDFMLEGVVK